MEANNVWFAFGLTLFAGMATGIGSAIAFFAKKTNTRFLSVALGFSAGVMIYVSMIEIFFKARDSLAATYGDTRGYWYTTIAFFAGMAFIGVIDRLVPSFENPHEPRKIEEMEENCRHLEEHGIPYLHGDATQESVLRAAHVERAGL